MEHYCRRLILFVGSTFAYVHAQHVLTLELTRDCSDEEEEEEEEETLFDPKSANVQCITLS